jgi:hypothetical protein
MDNQILSSRRLGTILWILPTFVVDSFGLRCNAVDDLGGSGHVGNRLLWPQEAHAVR